MDIESNIKQLNSIIPKTNIYGEKVTLVAAVKTQSIEDINRAIACGITDIGDNRAQEFRDKFGGITPTVKRHFIGHMQSNKLKYLVGKVDLFHSVDRMEIAQELDLFSQKLSVKSNILLQVNIGNESTKSGFDYNNCLEAYKSIAQCRNLEVKGLMAMLPDTDDEQQLKTLALKMRKLFDVLKCENPTIEHLSMGMSSDYKLCIECGSNMIRLGTAIFGERTY